MTELVMEEAWKWHLVAVLYASGISVSYYRYMLILLSSHDPRCMYITHREKCACIRTGTKNMCNGSSTQRH